MTQLAMHAVYTAGTFDLFHKGHVELFRKCRTFGDLLIVVLNTDDFIERYKGQSPIMSYNEREALIATNRFVDRVIPNTDCEKCFYTILNHVVDNEYDDRFTIVVGDDWKSKDYAAQMGVMDSDLGLFYGAVKYVSRYNGISATDIKDRVVTQWKKY